MGVLGALAASIVGRIAHKKSPQFTLTIAIILSSLSYICFFIFGYQMWGLFMGVILLDLGIQSGQISNQARINALDAEARSRNNAMYMAFYFCGGAPLGTLLWGLSGWVGVCIMGIIFQIIAASTHVLSNSSFVRFFITQSIKIHRHLHHRSCLNWNYLNQNLSRLGILY